MKYIQQSFEKYLEYLESVKDELPSSVYSFAKDENRYMLDNPSSLHDAWVKSISIFENRNNERPFNSECSIKITLLGQMHDRDIILTYDGVESYEMIGEKNQFNYNDTYHGDVLTHETRLGVKSNIIHEIEFASDSRIKIICKNFEVRESKLTEPHT